MCELSPHERQLPVTHSPTYLFEETLEVKGQQEPLDPGRGQRIPLWSLSVQRDSTDPFTLHLWPLGLWETKSLLLQIDRFVVLYHGSHGKNAYIW